MSVLIIYVTIQQPDLKLWPLMQVQTFFFLGVYIRYLQPDVIYNVDL